MKCFNYHELSFLNWMKEQRMLHHYPSRTHHCKANQAQTGSNEYLNGNKKNIILIKYIYFYKTTYLNTNLLTYKKFFF